MQVQTILRTLPGHRGWNWLVYMCYLSVCVYLRFLRKDAGSLASSVLTKPNSCMTLSSCLRSSWPFNRNMNSWPLLPVDRAIQYRNDALLKVSCQDHYMVELECSFAALQLHLYNHYPRQENKLDHMNHVIPKAGLMETLSHYWTS